MTEKKDKTRPSKGKQKNSMRSLAQKLHRSPSHICRVMRGKRVSARLTAELKRRGIQVEVA